MARVLFVDDDPLLLESLRCALGSDFQLVTASSGDQALEILRETGPFPVVVSRLRTPGMGGVELLSRVRRLHPDSSRIMLTGHADLEVAISAINDGNIFRFLTKPCPPPVLADAIRSGVRQYNLINSEKELLQHTLSGSIKLLTDLLAKAHPIAYGRAARLRGLVGRMAHALDSGNSWLLEMATMLSQVGCMGVPENILARAYHGESLSPEQERLFHSHPAMGRALLENLPRLREVAEIVGCQEKRFDGKGLPSGGPVGKEIPLGARILKIVLDYDTLEQSSRKADEIILELSKRAGWYDLDLLQVLVSVLEENPPARVHSVRVIDLTSSAVLAEDLVTTTGLKILNKNQEITPAVCVALRKLMETGFSFREPIRIAMPHDQ